MEGDQAKASLIEQAEIWKYMLSFADTMALRTAVELRIPDIIKNSPGGGPISLSQIATGISCDTSPDISILGRIMRLLVHRKIFLATAEEPLLYGLTPSSTWLLTSDTSSDLSLAAMVHLTSHPWTLAAWNHLSEAVRSGGTVFECAYEKDLWGYLSENPTIGKIFNDGLDCTAKIAMRAVLGEYGDKGFDGLRSVVDVGGGTGLAVYEIVKSYPKIEGINFDLPHVVSAAPEYPGVCHVGGDMFESVPKAEAVFIKWVLHDWGDEECVKILKNCLKAIPKETGKVIIVDMVLELEDCGLFNDTCLIFDLLMRMYFSAGKERTENEWKKVLKDGGFPRYNIIKTHSLFSIIEAYPY